MDNHQPTSLYKNQHLSSLHQHLQIEQVKFSVGKKVDIGYAQAAHVVHVYDLEATQDERLTGVNVRRAQVLQSLDANLGKAEIIKLPAGIDQKLPAN